MLASEHIVPSKNAQKAENRAKPTTANTPLQTSRIPAAMRPNRNGTSIMVGCAGVLVV